MREPRFRDPLPLGGDSGLPYSKGLMARALITTGLSPEQAYDLARRVERDLADRGETSTELDRLHELALELLGEAEGGQVVRRLRRYRELQELDVPILLLIGGSTGTGKSTVATEAAHRLGITRFTSTDFIRQTMRAFFSKDFMPAIHYSSYQAAEALREPDAAEDPLVAGFLEQTRNVLVGVHASIERALHEGLSMAIEGIHLVPGMLPVEARGALVVPCVLAIADEDAHAARFYVRDVASDGLRPVQKYLDGFAEIRRLQDYIVRRAERNDVPVVENADLEAGVDAVLELVLAGAQRLQKVP